MRLVITILGLLFLVSFAGTAFAQQASSEAKVGTHEQAVHELFEVTKIEKVFTETVEAALQQAIQANPDLAQYQDVMRAFFVKYMSWESLQGEMTRLYMDIFTESEVRQLTAFYKAPVGRKAADAQPRLAAEGMAIGQRGVQENMSELQAMFQARKKELEAQ